MFETVCLEHWRLLPPPNEFNIVCCSHDKCQWCEIDKFILDKQPTRFMRNVKRHHEQLKQDKLMRSRRIFVISE